VSIDDTVTETQATFVARAIEHDRWKAGGFFAQDQVPPWPGIIKSPRARTGPRLAPGPVHRQPARGAVEAQACRRMQRSCRALSRSRSGVPGQAPPGSGTPGLRHFSADTPDQPVRPKHRLSQPSRGHTRSGASLPRFGHTFLGALSQGDRQGVRSRDLSELQERIRQGKTGGTTGSESPAGAYRPARRPAPEQVRGC
jgi:hypothetical protein